jgi:hypothetical protein
VHDQLLQHRHHLGRQRRRGREHLLGRQPLGRRLEHVDLRLGGARELLAHRAGEHQDGVGADDAALGEGQRGAQRLDVLVREGRLGRAWLGEAHGVPEAARLRLGDPDGVGDLVAGQLAARAEQDRLEIVRLHARTVRVPDRLLPRSVDA